MKVSFYTFFAMLWLSLISCNESNKKVKEDVLVGELTVSVDESVYPIYLEQKQVFENSYKDATIVAVPEPEGSAINKLLAGTSSFAILTRNLTEAEENTFKQRSITPRIFPIGYDAIVVVGNVSNPDTSITISNIIGLMKGDASSNITLVFDNLNSSIFRYFRDLGKLSKVANTYVEGVTSSEAVLKAVVENDMKVGLISLNQYLSLKSSFSEINKIRILSVLNESLVSPKYVLPSQATLSTDEYPLKRTIYALNYQPNLGLGIGFSSFLTGDRGQRIMLKSGLLPATMPGREIIIRDGFNK